MADQSLSGNPYTPFAVASSGRLFFGREAVFEWLQRSLAEETSGQPLVLAGAARIGKSSILRQIEAGRLGPEFAAVYVDLSATAGDSQSAFLWEVAYAVFLALGRQHIDLPQLNQTEFIADPYRAFREQFLQPAVAALDSRTLLFLFDNPGPGSGQNNPGQHLVYALHDLIGNHERAACIIALEKPDNGAGTASPSLGNTRLCEIGPLADDAAIALVRQPVMYTIVNDVAQHIVKITGGRPYETQQLCHALYERQRQLSLSHITVADVAAVKRAALAMDSTSGSAAGAPVYQLRAHPSLAQTIRRVGWRYQWPRGALLLALAVLFLLAAGAAILPAITRQRSLPQPGQNAAAGTATGVALMAFLQTPPGEAGIVATPSSTATAPALAPPSSTTAAGETAAPPPTETATATPSPTPTATPSPTPSRYPPVLTRTQDNMLMILIAEGAFLMGAAEGDVMAAPDERPQHEVTLDRFYIDKYEVSVAQYAAFLNRLGGYERACSRFDCSLPRQIAGYTSYISEQDLGDGTLQYVPIVGYANYPANHISWYGAFAYCESVRARLPTEAEWEYAARGDDGRLYPWGNRAPDPSRAVFQSDSFENLKPVDALPDGASPFGVFGMAGSMWEWTADWYDESYYSISPASNPTGPETGFSRVIRGGAWPNNNQADRIRAANRSSLSPDFISSTVGFRCARTP